MAGDTLYIVLFVKYLGHDMTWEFNRQGLHSVHRHGSAMSNRHKLCLMLR